MHPNVLRAALLVSSALVATPAIAQNGGARDTHVKLNGVKVYDQKTGAERGTITPKAYDLAMASTLSADSKQRLRDGGQFAIVDGAGALVGAIGPGYECIKDPRFTELPQCAGGGSDSGRDTHAKLNGVKVYDQKTGAERGTITTKAYDLAMASTLSADSKQRLRSGGQFAIVDGAGALVGAIGPGYECIKDPRFTEMPQCGAKAASGSAPASGPAAPAVVLQPPLTKLASALDKPGAGQNAAIAFVSTDGSARLGSHTAFVLRNTQSGETVVVSVEGRAAKTRTQAYVRPGTYEILPPKPSIAASRSFTIKSVSQQQVTVRAGGAPTTVSFSLAEQVSPFILTVSEVAATSVGLKWLANPSVNVASYTLVRTDGGAPAANSGAGTRVPLGAGMTANVTGLAPGREYTFTLFGTDRSGGALPSRSITATTARDNSNGVAYALAPNTIVPTNFTALNAQPVAESKVRVTLSPAAVRRSSRSELPGVSNEALDASGCIVGAPFIATTEVAKDNAFIGVVEVCEAQTSGATTAIVDTDVPLAAVFDYFHLVSKDDTLCFDAKTGNRLTRNAKNCSDTVPRAVRNVGPPLGQQAAANPNAPAGDKAGGNAGSTLPFASETNLARGQKYWSQSGGHYLVFQPDNNLAVLTKAGAVVWALNKVPGVDLKKIARVTWQADGNLAAYGPKNEYVWSALSRNPDPKAQLLINEKGTLQIVSPTRGMMWSAATINASVPKDDVEIALVAPRGADDFKPARPATIAQFAPSAAPTLFRGARMPFAPIAAVQPVAIAPARPDISCEGDGEANISLNPEFGPYRDIDVRLDGFGLSWEVQIGVKAGIKPQFELEGKMGCSLDIMPLVDAQLAMTPIPVHLYIKPEIAAEASAKVSVEGPELAVSAGLISKGHLKASIETCAFVPCGFDIDFDQKTEPFTDFERGDVEATLEGTLGFTAGVEANLGIGVKNKFWAAKNGLALRAIPLSVELTAVVGTSNCASASVGFQIDADLVAEAWVVKPEWGEEYRYNLFKSGQRAYPGASFTIGQCEDSDVSFPLAPALPDKFQLEATGIGNKVQATSSFITKPSDSNDLRLAGSGGSPLTFQVAQDNDGTVTLKALKGFLAIDLGTTQLASRSDAHNVRYATGGGFFSPGLFSKFMPVKARRAAGPNAVSFESTTFPGLFLRHSGNRLYVSKPGDANFDVEATWQVKEVK